MSVLQVYTDTGERSTRILMSVLQVYTDTGERSTSLHGYG